MKMVLRTVSILEANGPRFNSWPHVRRNLALLLVLVGLFTYDMVCALEVFLRLGKSQVHSHSGDVFPHDIRVFVHTASCST
jgi:hypothetical protein